MSSYNQTKYIATHYNMKGRFDYRGRLIALGRSYNVEPAQIPSIVRSLYLDEYMTSEDIAAVFSSRINLPINARTVQRWLKQSGATARNKKESFNLAIKKGRVDWSWQRKPEAAKSRRNRLQDRKRYAILKRDGFKCVLCGATAEHDLLEIDHIIAAVHGGETTDDNLRTLCNSCNMGKRVAEGEK